MQGSALLLTWEGQVGELEVQASTPEDMQVMTNGSVAMAQSVMMSMGFTQVNILFYLEGQKTGEFRVTQYVNPTREKPDTPPPAIT